ncbi:AAA family ATPase [Acidimicrobiia bacterium EGI L10123]|uniref:bifunctional aminoglycoside phosphotransferase/ATP-binding protein n=1 Tax=Salinilacustrithrix flava TaxID=2957203 RepID=UPI003D7C2100|nr:AAA family ATPase [Acidimicrobiia bacterium EGI L10123]
MAVETHTGAVLLVGDLAYKVKKPVSVGFLDWTSRADRLRAIEDELSLNRRLAPDVYLGTGLLPVPGGDGEPVLVMRRLPADRRLSTLVAQGRDVDDALRALAHQLAAFHLRGATTSAAAAAAGPAETLRRWEVNHERMRPAFGEWIDGEAAELLLERASAYLRGRATLLEERVSRGWARDGHGDLLAEDVFCLDDGPRVLDCLDFDERLRVGDVLADMAFLAMDLERLGRADLGWRLLELHREMTGDSWPPSLAHHHVAYRAQVRTLVSCVRAGQGDAAAGAQAAQLLDIATRHAAAARVRMVLVGGSPATGKSTIAAGLGDRLDATVLRSDEIRKELAGRSVPDDCAAELRSGIYSEAWTDRTYDELLRRAGRLVARGECVVLDATWAERKRRRAARAVAEATSTDLVELRCVVDAETARQRAAARARTGADVSDADASIASALAASFEPWDGAAAISTASSPAASLDTALAAVERG